MRSDTLLVKHLPKLLDNKEKEDFLKHFGAIEVKCIASMCNKYNLAFARFENENIAEDVLHRLHQVDVLGSCLTVEFAKSNTLNTLHIQQEINSSGTNENRENEKFYKQFIEKLSSWHSGVNFKQPVPCHLKYQYPPPSEQTLLNIVKALASVPKFYTQVLHLMNKMNLPCPFGSDILPNIEIDIFQFKNGENTVTEPIKETESKSTSESEISTDEDVKDTREPVQVINYKVKKRRKIKISKLLNPLPVTTQKSKKTTFDEVFEKPVKEKEAKKIKLSHITPIPADQVAPMGEEAEQTTPSSSGFGFIHPVKKPEEAEPVKDIRDEREEERLEREEIVCITEKELNENRISEKDRSVLPVFKNYAEGAPTCRLYIKNLSKTVTESDLKYIYHRYLNQQIEGEPVMFDIRLMQEGRMKGQAFVTLQSVELAQKALKETNGYILKDKPLVVQFARSAVK